MDIVLELVEKDYKQNCKIPADNFSPRYSRYLVCKILVSIVGRLYNTVDNKTPKNNNIPNISYYLLLFLNISYYFPVFLIISWYFPYGVAEAAP